MSIVNNTIAGLALAVMAAGAASAQEDRGYYVAFSGGVSLLGDSQNDGAFDGDFTTGAGTTIPAGTVLPDGTDVGWDTDFDTGYAFAGAIGRRYGPFRGELEIAYQDNDIGSHANVAAAGIALDGEDAGVLITGSPNIGVTVGDLVADGQGDVSSLFVMANILYDFRTGGRLTPYIGGGAGVGFVDVNYTPSAVAIIQDEATAFAYQALAGVAYAVSPKLSLTAGYRYRATTDVDVEADLFAADFEIENSTSIIEAGLRLAF